jgi:glycogen operon protein
VYYRLAEDRRHYVDYTGTGNTLSTQHPIALRLIFDSLRYWVSEMHVDGFRFDLASTLAREQHAFDHFGAFLDIARQDPVLSQVKLIAEPWDLGEGGYQVGGFPPGWSDWNGRYRDAGALVLERRRRARGRAREPALGSSDIFAPGGRGPTASINFITAHDGFTLRDLVSYNDKHNEANGEHNNDGESHNRSWNCGVEGPDRRPGIRALRLRQMRNFLATLFFSQGVPMLVAGDEMAARKAATTIAYCQDNELSWMRWDSTTKARASSTSRSAVIALRNKHPLFRRLTFFAAAPVRDSDAKDIVWLQPDGGEMSDEEWSQGTRAASARTCPAAGMSERDEHGVPVEDDDLMLLFNASDQEIASSLA